MCQEYYQDRLDKSDFFYYDFIGIKYKCNGVLYKAMKLLWHRERCHKSFFLFHKLYFINEYIIVIGLGDS